MNRVKKNARVTSNTHNTNTGNAIFTQVERDEYKNAWRVEQACGDIRIGEGADWIEFANCSIDPFRVWFPSTVQRIIAKNALGLKEIVIDDNEDPDAWVMLQVSGSENLNVLYLPPHCIRVDAHYCHGLKHLALPKRFEWADFFQCTGLTGLDMPSPSVLKYVNIIGGQI